MISIKPIKLKEYSSKQSTYDLAPKVPFRFTLLGPTHSGNSVLISNFILDIYKNVFSKVYIFSQSIFIDQTFEPIKEYLTDELKQQENEQYLFDHFDEAELANIIDTQFKIIEYQKKQNMKKMFNILIVLDDMVDVERTRHSKVLNSLFVRGRHAFISVINSVQYYYGLPTLIRKQISDLFLFKIRNKKDLDAVIEEMSALYDKNTLLKMYHYCTDQPYGFLWINLRAKSPAEMFHFKFEKKLLPD